MSLKRPQEMLSSFSMASMTDVVFLLLVFFMVTSSFVFPTALELELPQSSQQTPLKPSTKVFIDADGALYLSLEGAEPVAVSSDSLVRAIRTYAPADSTGAVAVYADESTPYGKVVEVLDAGAANEIKMVLATRPTAALISTTDERHE